MLSLSNTILWFAFSLSFIVRISLSTLPFPLWSFIGRITCLMKYLWQNSWIFLLLKTVPGSVQIWRGTPLSAIYFVRNSVTLVVVGSLRNFASGHPDLLSTETIKYFFVL